jgi:hypothetical protein
MPRYKVWMHVEEIPDDPDEDPISLDWILPEAIYIADTFQKAQEFMTEMNLQHYRTE